MTFQVAMLRGVNVGGHRKIAMAALREFVSTLGFADVSSLLQSGNLVFRSDGPVGSALETFLEAEAAKRLVLTTEFFVRSAAECARVIAANPFPEEALRDPGHLLVMFFKKPIKSAMATAVQAAITGPERVSASGRELYLHYPAGIGTSRLTGSLIERKVEARGTARNWNTVRKLAALCGV